MKYSSSYSVKKLTGAKKRKPLKPKSRDELYPFIKIKAMLHQWFKNIDLTKLQQQARDNVHKKLAVKGTVVHASNTAISFDNLASLNASSSADLTSVDVLSSMDALSSTSTKQNKIETFKFKKARNNCDEFLESVQIVNYGQRISRKESSAVKKTFCCDVQRRSPRISSSVKGKSPISLSKSRRSSFRLSNKTSVPLDELTLPQDKYINVSKKRTVHSSRIKPRGNSKIEFL